MKMTDFKQSSEETRKPKEKDKKYRQLLKEFTENSSAGGVNKVFSSKPLFLRIIWSILCVTCYGAMAYLSSKLIQQYMGNPTATFVDVSFQGDMSFPSVTVCNLNKFRNSTLRRNLPEIDKILNDYRKQQRMKNKNVKSWKNENEKRISYLKNIYARSGVKNNSEIDADSVSSEEILNQLIIQASSKYSKKELSKSGYRFRHFFTDCQWMGVKCNEGYFRKYWTQMWNWKYGNCYVLNFGLDSKGNRLQQLRTNKAGPSNGLQFDIFLAQKEYIPELNSEAGVKVVIVDQMQYPFPYHEGVSVAPGKSTSIALRKELIERVDAFDNNSCIHDTSQMSNIYSKNGFLAYTVQSCLDSCLVGFQKQRCNCTDPRYPLEGHVCSTESEYECISHIDQNYKGDDFGCLTKCPQLCRSVSYRTTLSDADVSSQSQKSLREVLRRNENFKDSVKTKEDFLKDFLRVKIYYEELNLVRIQEQFTYSISTLMADIGGQLGLWVGLSVITFAELGDLLLSVLMLMFSKTEK